MPMDKIRYCLDNIIGKSNTDKIYQHFTSLQLCTCTAEDLYPYVSKKIANQVVSVFSIRYLRMSTGKIIRTSNDSYEHVKELAQCDHEKFCILCLSRANRLIKIVDHSDGGTNGTVVDVKRILLAAIQNKCSAIILAHNHPSGNKQPSSADIQITKKVKDACKLVDMELLDHIIVASEPTNSYYSFADEGML